LLKKDSIVEAASKDLTVAQAEKLASLAESIEFDSVESFENKINTIKESYFPAEKVVVSEEAEVEQSEGDDVTETSPLMSAYLDAIKLTSKN